MIIVGERISVIAKRVREALIKRDPEPLKELAIEAPVQVSVDEKQDRVTELFDKYNLLALPVVDAYGVLAGVKYAEPFLQKEVGLVDDLTLIPVKSI